MKPIGRLRLHIKSNRGQLSNFFGSLNSGKIKEQVPYFCIDQSLKFRIQDSKQRINATTTTRPIALTKSIFYFLPKNYCFKITDDDKETASADYKLKLHEMVSLQGYSPRGDWLVVGEGEAEGVCTLVLLTLFDAFFPWDEKHGKQLILRKNKNELNPQNRKGKKKGELAQKLFIYTKTR